MPPTAPTTITQPAHDRKKILPKMVPLSRAAADACFGVSTRTLKAWVESGRITGSKLGGRWFVTAESAQKLRDGSI
jgi:hypothetical protein